MPRLVMKFGGTSVGDGARINNVAGLVQREIAKGRQVVVVASAMSGVTNMLIEAAKLAARGDESLIADTRRRLFAQHIAAAHAITRPGEVTDKLVAELGRVPAYAAGVVAGDVAARVGDTRARVGAAWRKLHRTPTAWN